MSFSIGLSKTSFNSELVVHFMRQQGGWALFAAGLALIQVAFTTEVIGDLLYKMYEPTLLKLGFTSAKVWLSMLVVGFIGAFFLESVMFFFILNARPLPATIMAFITGGIGLFSKCEGALSFAADMYGVPTLLTSRNVYLLLLIAGVIYSIKEIAFMYNSEHQAMTQAKALEEAIKDKLIELESSEIQKMK